MTKIQNDDIFYQNLKNKICIDKIEVTRQTHPSTDKSYI